MPQKYLELAIPYIDSWLKFRYERDDLPGFAVAVAHKGEVLFKKAYGFADIEKRVDLSTDHLFRIASHSKTFTATAIMLLQEENKLRIDDYCSDYISWLKDHKDKRWSKVTLRQLMSHAAGISRDGSRVDYWQLDLPFPDEEQFKKIILESNLVLDNNTKVKYSNLGYSLLGLVVETVSGKPYNDFVRERIIEPLGLKNTSPEITEDNIERLVTGYSRMDFDKKRLPIAQVKTHALSPATGFCSNLDDLSAYFYAHKIGSGKLLGDESKKEMQRTQWHLNTNYTPDHEDYGLGLEIVFFGDRQVFGHGGGFPGQSTNSYFDPKEELSVIVLTNCIDASPGWMAKGIFGVLGYFKEKTTQSKPKHELRHLSGRYMNLWAISDVVVTGDTVVTVYPDTWEPMSIVQELEYVDDTTLKLVNADSFDSDSELLEFKLKDGKVTSLRYAGATMLPEEDWERVQTSRQIVDLP